jgi:hypothetical protein
MSASAPYSQTMPPELAEHLADAHIERWAHDCGWIPGSGYCRNLDCGRACTFHAQREADAMRVRRHRQQRRSRSRHGFDRQTGRLFPLLLSLLEVLALA